MFFAAIYRGLVPHRPWLYAFVLVLAGLGLVGLLRLEMSEDIEAMLPDDTSSVADDFRRLRKAPFARKVLISLTRDEEVDTVALLETADRLAGALPIDYFSRSLTGPAELGKGNLPAWLSKAMPNLMTTEDRARVGAGLTAQKVQRQVESNYRRLLSPEGWLVKGMIRRDPLDLTALGLEKLRYLNPISKTRLQNGQFLSADGGSALILADTPVAITDSRGSGEMMDRFRQTVELEVPEGIDVTLISGHSYTLANARAIQDDLFIVLGLSTIAIFTLFLFFLRSWRAVFIFFVPASVIGLAAVAVSLCYETVSGVTIGFGAVLLGIAVDFGVHVYFALRHEAGEADAILGRVARPVLFGGLTTLAGFAVLLTSSLPGQRQLAVFSLTGIGAALFLALVVLPHLVAASRQEPRGVRPNQPRILRRKSWPVLLAWLIVMAVCGWQAGNVAINGELRSLSLVPEELQASESKIQQTWGNMRSMAMVFAEGPDLQSALLANDRLFTLLRLELPGISPVSLAPVLPAEATQAENRRQWGLFWDERSGQARALLKASGAPLGFSANAFDPFFADLAREPEAIVAEDLRQNGLGDLLDALLLKDETGVQVITLLPDAPEVSALFGDGSEAPTNVHLVSPSRFGREVGRAIRGDFVRFITLAALAVLIMLAALFRHPGRVVLAALPVASGLLVMFGLMGWMGIELNLFNIVATILIIGLGVDYGIFMVCRGRDGEGGSTRRAVLVAGLTTLAGFGALVFASHPALNSIGATVLLGIGGAVPTALWVIPALDRKEAA